MPERAVLAAADGEVSLVGAREADVCAPRLAVAIDPTGAGRTSVHAAYGHYYDHHITGNVAVGRIVNGSTGVRTFAARFPASIAAWQAPDHRLPEPSSAFPSVEIAIDPALETPYARHVSAGVDRAFGRDISVSVNLVSVRGRHQLGTIDFNPIVPGELPAACRLPTPVWITAHSTPGRVTRWQEQVPREARRKAKTQQRRIQENHDAEKCLGLEGDVRGTGVLAHIGNIAAKRLGEKRHLCLLERCHVDLPQQDRHFPIRSKFVNEPIHEVVNAARAANPLQQRQRAALYGCSGGCSETLVMKLFCMATTP